jgi:hypothetical protein
MGWLAVLRALIVPWRHVSPGLVCRRRSGWPSPWDERCHCSRQHWQLGSTVAAPRAAMAAHLLTVGKLGEHWCCCVPQRASSWCCWVLDATKVASGAHHQTSRQRHVGCQTHGCTRCSWCAAGCCSVLLRCACDGGQAVQCRLCVAKVYSVARCFCCKHMCACCQGCGACWAVCPAALAALHLPCVFPGQQCQHTKGCIPLCVLPGLLPSIDRHAPPPT